MKQVYPSSKSYSCKATHAIGQKGKIPISTLTSVQEGAIIMITTCMNADRNKNKYLIFYHLDQSFRYQNQNYFLHHHVNHRH